jgi:hypothetical protein
MRRKTEETDRAAFFWRLIVELTSLIIRIEMITYGDSVLYQQFPLFLISLKETTERCSQGSNANYVSDFSGATGQIHTGSD